MDFLKRFNIYQLVTAFLLSLYILGSFQFGLSKVLMQLIFPVMGATIAGIIFDFIELKRFQKPITPFITGLIIGLVAQFGEDPQTLILMGAIAMLIKFSVKLDNRHIFNPAAGGLLADLLFFNSAPSWWSGGSMIWPFLIWIPIFLLRFRRWAPMAGFLLPLVVFNGLNILLSASLLFFISVMLIEPKTSPAEIKTGLIYGLLVGIGYMLFAYLGVDPFIPSLLAGNLGSRLLGKFLL